ncbi:unnamed protein product, partial [Mesorhabditis spiculigera]
MLESLYEEAVGHSIPRDATARSLANSFLSGLKRKSDEKRIKAARELYRFIQNELKDEGNHYVNEFFHAFDASSKDKEKNELQDCLRESSEIEEKRAGIFIIVCILEAPATGEASRVNRYANLLLRSLTQPNTDEHTMELAARGLSYLIQTSKVTELVNKCMDQCLEWLEDNERQEKRRLAAAFLTRELALFTPTAFFARATNFFKNIFKVVHDAKYISEGYLVCQNKDVRIAAVKCTVNMIIPFMKVFHRCHREYRGQLQETIIGVLTRVVSVGVVDRDVEVRLCVLDTLFNGSFPLLSLLATDQMLTMLFMCIHDEKPEIQVAAIRLLGKKNTYIFSIRMTEVNPAVIIPRLRRILLESLSQLKTSGNARLEQHSARLICQLARQNPDFIKVYVSPTTEALLSRLRIESVHSDVTVEVLDCLGELALVGGSEMVRNLPVVFKFLHQCITDSSHRRRRQAALRAMCRIVRTTAYTEMSAEMRRQTIQVLGVLGALDPYLRKVYLGDVPSSSTLSTALSMPSTRFQTDTRQEVIQWFNYEKCTLEEFYPSITLANLMLMVQDDAYNDHYKQIVQALLTIFQGMNQDEYKAYVEQVLPRLIEVTRKNRQLEHRKFFISQIAQLVDIVRLHAKNYMKSIFQMIAEAWCEDQSMKLTIISALELMGTALGKDFAPFVDELIPYLLRVIQSDRTAERRLTTKVLACVGALSGCLTPHLHLVLPPILAIVDDSNSLMNMWRHFDVYRTSVDMALLKHNLQCPEYDRLTFTMMDHELKHVRDMYDTELTALAGESYERAYGAMVLIQQLAELEEAIEYRVRKDRRLRISLLWSRRLLDCQEDVEQWQRALFLW